jgi:predicted Zn-ribbon and HTH transcriptional regulator
MLVMTPTHCGHCFYEVLSQNVKLYPRNMKWKLL